MDPRSTVRLARRLALLYGANPPQRAAQQLLRYLLRRAGGRTPVTTAVLAVTYRCQARCPHCYAAVEGRDTAGELETGEWCALLDRLRAQGTLQVFFTGGEPLLREDLPQLIAHAHRIGLLTRICTNGFLLTPAAIARLKRAGLNQCGISIDDVDPQVHDRLRGLPGAFARALEAFENLRAQGIDSRILVYASRDKVPSGIERIVELATRLRVGTVHVNIPFAVGRWSGNSDAVLSGEEMAALRALVRRQPRVTIEFPRAGTPCFVAGRRIVGIGPRGEVLPCPAVPFPIGNVREEGFDDIWRRHAGARLPAWRGSCPLNCEDGRAVLQAHGQSMRQRPGGRQRGTTC